MPTATINVPLARLNAGVGTQLLGIYNEQTLAAGSTAGIFCGPISLPEWVDPSYPSRLFIYPRGANPAVPGQAIVFQANVLRLLTDTTRVSQINEFTYPPPAAWNGTSPRVEVTDDTTPGEPLYPAHTFAAGDSLGFLLNRLGAHVGDTYTLSMSVGTYLQLVCQKRCQMPCC